MGLKINLKSFNDLPLLDVNTQINSGKKNSIAEVQFPPEYANQSICFQVGDEIAYFTADVRGVVLIKDKELSKNIARK